MAALSGSVEVLFAARLIGGIAAGMAFPTTLSLITALWSGSGRTKSIALWSSIGGAFSALGPLAAGALLEHHAWGSVFLITLPLAVVALVLAVRLIPNHVNESTDPVDNFSGMLSILLIAALVLGLNFAPVPDKGLLALGLILIALATTVVFVFRQRKLAVPLYDLDVAGRRIFWVAAVAGIIVFGSLMAAMFIGQQFLQNVLSYSTLDAGAAILPAAVFMVIVAPRSAKLVESHGARFTLLVGYVFCLLGFVTMLVLWNEGIPYWKVALAYSLMGIGVGFAGTDGIGTGQARRNGVGDRRSPARPRRSDHAVAARSAADRGIRGGGQHRNCGRTERRRGHEFRAVPTDQVFRRRGIDRDAIPAVLHSDRQRSEAIVPRRPGLGIRCRYRRCRAGICARLPDVPEEG
jgi:hypothetical protein